MTTDHKALIAELRDFCDIVGAGESSAECDVVFPDEPTVWCAPCRAADALAAPQPDKATRQRLAFLTGLNHARHHEDVMVSDCQHPECVGSRVFFDPAPQPDAATEAQLREALTLNVRNKALHALRNAVDERISDPVDRGNVAHATWVDAIARAVFPTTSELPEGAKGGRRLRCSFCGKEKANVKYLIGGPGDVRICNECVETIVENNEAPPTYEPTGNEHADHLLDLADRSLTHHLSLSDYDRRALRQAAVLFRAAPPTGARE